MPVQQIAFGPFVFDPQRGTLTRDSLPISVGHRGLSLLNALLRAKGQVVYKAELMEAAWPATAVEESNLSVQVAALRKLLGSSPSGNEWIVTVPRVGYRFAGLGVAAVDERQDHRAYTERTAKPRIAVLPFTNLSGDKRQEYLADGLTEDIITALARFRWFFVIARNSSFIYKGRAVEAEQIAQDLRARYLLEGSVRKAGSRARISVQLIDASAGTHIWAERYDLALTDLFAIQDEIAERVAGAIEPELLKTESILAPARHTGNMSAWDLVRQGTWHFHQVTRPTHLRARELFRDACMVDPHLPEAHIWRARVSAGLIAYGWSQSPSLDWQEGLEAALCAVELDNRNPYSHYALAIVSAYGDDVAQAVRASEEAVELSPSFALGHLVCGMAHLFAGRARDAIKPLEYGLQLSPHDPQNFVWMNLLALAHLFSGQSASALQVSTKALKIRPAWRPLVETIACCHAACGDWDQARRYVQQMVRIERPPGDALAPLRRWNPHWLEQIADTLQKAGRGAADL